MAARFLSGSTKFKRAGLVTFGKTNVPEFGVGADNGAPPLRPRRAIRGILEHSTGGSSGGSGGCGGLRRIVPLAHANDRRRFGSRIPASCCGLVGLKPTRARSSMGPDFRRLDRRTGRRSCGVAQRARHGRGTRCGCWQHAGRSLLFDTGAGILSRRRETQAEEVAHCVRHGRSWTENALHPDLCGGGEACGETVRRSWARGRRSLAQLGSGDAASGLHGALGCQSCGRHRYRRHADRPDAEAGTVRRPHLGALRGRQVSDRECLSDRQREHEHRGP